MNKQHPDDLQLQRYLNKACSEHEYKRIRHHLRSCPVCKSSLYAFVELESALEDLPLLEAPPGLEENVMQAVREARKPQTAPARSGPNHHARFRSELVHCFIATAATFLFISSGLWTRMVTMNPVQWSADVQHQVSFIELLVHRLSVQLLS